MVFVGERGSLCFLEGGNRIRDFMGDFLGRIVLGFMGICWGIFGGRIVILT